jgi:hypothetical protein
MAPWLSVCERKRSHKRTGIQREGSGWLSYNPLHSFWGQYLQWPPLGATSHRWRGCTSQRAALRTKFPTWPGGHIQTICKPHGLTTLGAQLWLYRLPLIVTECVHLSLPRDILMGEQISKRATVYFYCEVVLRRKLRLLQGRGSFFKFYIRESWESPRLLWCGRHQRPRHSLSVYSLTLSVQLLASRLLTGPMWPLGRQPSAPSSREKIKEGRRAKGHMPPYSFSWVSLEVLFNNFHFYPISHSCKGCWEVQSSTGLLRPLTT